MNEIIVVFSCAADRDAIARPYARAQCHPHQNTDGDAPKNSARAVRVQRRYFPASANNAVQQTPDEAIGLHLGPDPRRVAPAKFPPKGWRRAPVNWKSAGRGGRQPDPPEPRFDVRKVLRGLQTPPLWWSHPEIWRRRDWVITDLSIAHATSVVCPEGQGSPLLGYSPGTTIPFGATLPPNYEHDKRSREECTAEIRKVSREAAMAAPFPSNVILSREMFVEQLGLAYALLSAWPAGGNETQASVLHYTILRMLDWTPDDTPATALAQALAVAGWSKAPYARSFQNMRHFANSIAQRADHYAKSLGRNRLIIPAMRDDIPVQFKNRKVSHLGEKKKVGISTLLNDRMLTPDATTDVWDAIAGSRAARGGRFAGLPSRASGCAVPANRRIAASKPTITVGGDVAGRGTLAERYGERLAIWQLKMVDRALDGMEDDRQREQARNIIVDGRPTPDMAIAGFKRDDGGDTHGTAAASSSGTRRARGAAAARAVVERLHHEITFHEWLDTLDLHDDYETIRVIALTLHHWGSGQPHEDLAHVTSIDPEVQRGRLALAFEGLRQALGYEPTSRRKVEAGMNRLAIRAETLENIAIEMTLNAEIFIPTKNGGRPRKLDAKVAAERMRYAALMLSLMEIVYEPLPLLLDGVIRAPGRVPLQRVVESIANVVAMTPVRPPSAERYEISIWEVIDALTEVGLLRDRELCGRRGGAARAAIAISWWTAEATVGVGAGNGLLSLDLDKLLEEYVDREPRAPTLAKRARPSKSAPRWRHIEDVRRLLWRRPDWHGSEPGIVQTGTCDRPSAYRVYDRADIHADEGLGARFRGVAP
jgi:hypothetical protein